MAKPSAEALLQQKYEQLCQLLKSYQSVAVAFSGGVDSTLLLAVAQQELGQNVLAVTAVSCSFPERERREAAAFCKARGIRQLVCQSEELAIPGFCENPKNRCYLCKKELFARINTLARQNGMREVLEGSNMDDNGDYRPGLQAVAELGVRSPLRAVGLYKAEIRALSQRLGLPTWSKPSFACLASRFVYGERITEEKLAMVEGAEQLLLDLGFRQVRVRIHDTMARIEVGPDEIARLAQSPLREKVYAACKALGFGYVSLDLGGYRTGSMNETLTPPELRAGQHFEAH